MPHPAQFMYDVPPNNVKMQHPFFDKYACWLNDAAIDNQKIDCNPLLRRNFDVFFSQKLFACWLNLACCPLPNQSSQFTSLQWRATSRKQKLEINLRNQPKHIFHIFLSHLLHCHQNLRTEWIWKKWERGGAQMHCCLLRCIAIYWDAPNILFFMHCLHLLLPHILLSVGAANKYSMLLQRTPSLVAKSHKNDLAHFPISLSSVATFVSDHDMTKSHILPAIIFCLGREYFQGQFFMSKLWKTSPVQTIPKAKVTFRLSVILGLQNWADDNDNCTTIKVKLYKNLTDHDIVRFYELKGLLSPTPTFPFSHPSPGPINAGAELVWEYLTSLFGPPCHP